jgi:copper homeostasis protein
VIVQSAADARAAEEGGADRLEIVREIECGGLTPPLDLVRTIAADTRLPLRVMVRENGGFTVASGRELAALQRTFEALAAIGVDGAVVGFARDGMLDLDTTRAVLSAAPNLRATFHRAFDMVRHPEAAIAELAALPQIDRLLTSGGEGGWPQRCGQLAALSALADGRMTLIAGWGVDAEGLSALAATRSVREAHVGRAAREPQVQAAPVSIERVRLLRRLADMK